MACRGKVLVAVVAVFLGLVAERQVTFVNGDKQLIESTCAEAAKLVPCDGCELSLVLACGNCLTYTPGSNGMDLKGLGKASIDCVTSESQKARDLALHMQSDYAAYGTALDNCIHKLQDGDLQIADGFKSWQGGRYADAATKVQAGAHTAGECIDGLKTEKQTEDLVDKISAVQILGDVSAGVLRQIH